MKRLIGISALIGLILTVNMSTVFAEKRIALVIGNSSYASQPLTNPANDAALMAKTLQEVGFEVISSINAPRRDLRRAVHDFTLALTAAGKDAVGFFYYAGHGIQAKGENYMIPIDAQIETAIDVEFEGFPASTLLSALESAGNRLNVVVMDACRNNPYKAATRSGGSGLARMDAPSGTMIAYSTAPGKVAADGQGHNSPYTRALSRAIRAPGKTIEQVFKTTRVAVMDRTNGAQVPWESSSLTGEFMFLDQQPEAVAAPTQPDNTAEITFWNSIKDGTDPAFFESYLSQYPNGTFAGLARAKIENLKKQANDNGRQEDLAFFQAIQNSENKTDFEAYLSQYPDGTFAALAKARIKSIEAKEAEQVASLSATPAVDPDTDFWNQVKKANSTAELQAYLDQFPDGKYATIAKARIKGLEEQQVASANPAATAMTSPWDGTWSIHFRGSRSNETISAPLCNYAQPAPTGDATITVQAGKGKTKIEMSNRDIVSVELSTEDTGALSYIFGWRGKSIAKGTSKPSDGVITGKKATISNCFVEYRLEKAS